MQSINQGLKDFGLDQTQIDIYLACLKLGKAKVQTIADEAGQKRTSIYEHLKKLEVLGLIRLIKEKRTQFFIPEPPKKLLEILKNREIKIESILPFLMSTYNSSQDGKPSMEYFSGKAGLITIYEDILTTTDKMYYYFASFDEREDIVSMKYFEDWTYRRIALKIDHKGLRSHQMKKMEAKWPKIFTDQGPHVLREYRYLPEDIKLPVRIYMYDKKVAILSLRGENWGIIIHSPDLNTALMSLFWFIWEKSEKVK